MAFQIPHNLINELQISLRKRANLSSYDPDDPSLPDLPSPEESIAALDPSPPYLRCKHCKGRLLRGIESLFCVFCGREQSKDLPPEAINFRNTLGCRWLLQSLELDGSEIVGPFSQANESSRKQNATEDEFPLSDLLNLEIKWTSESEKFGSSFSEEPSVWQQSSLNLAGVDLDNFFAEGEERNASDALEEQIVPKKVDEITGSTTHGNDKLKSFENIQHSETTVRSEEVNGNINFFENVQPSEAVPRSTEDDSFTGWEADFHSADSGTHHEESKSVDAFPSSSVDLSGHLDTVFGSKVDPSDVKAMEDAISSTSNADGLFSHNTWHTSNSDIAGEDKQFEVAISDTHVGQVEYENASSTTVDWTQGDKWQNSGSKESEDKAMDDDDSLDAWNEFTSSTGAQGNPSSSSKPIVNHLAPSAELTLEMNLFSSAVDLPNHKTTDKDDGFDAWNDFTSSKGAQDPSKSSGKPTVDDMMPSPGASFFSSANSLQDTKAMGKDDDLVDWDGFPSLTGAHDPLESSSEQTVNHVKTSGEQNSEINLLSGEKQSQNFDIGSFFQPELFSGVPRNQSSSTELISVQSEASVSERMADVNVRGGGSAEEEAKDGDVEMLMSQMHDLSFMLENKLTIPTKLDGSASFSKD
ncbi:hypothetical protein HS088_TW06G00256 [Tripterygium wilfordii]|uniref:DUF7815 domain-containing protein n=1 Tax=Tripterygium wilfordii TaxID=458696 RepID=A0A7J7DIA9_TRIWF|nr:uncharacterized protein LOC120001035 [Tripterygium wilfordii]KAF5746091.1 hypothetical protein HS088_TW06G00256 [Tripterygium wilfordii]